MGLAWFAVDEQNAAVPRMLSFQYTAWQYQPFRSSLTLPYPTEPSLALLPQSRRVCSVTIGEFTLHITTELYMFNHTHADYRGAEAIPIL